MAEIVYELLGVEPGVPVIECAAEPQQAAEADTNESGNFGQADVYNESDEASEMDGSGESDEASEMDGSGESDEADGANDPYGSERNNPYLQRLIARLGDFSDWEYVGGNKQPAQVRRYERYFGKDYPYPDAKAICVCDHDIEDNCYLQHKATREIVIVGSCCVRRFLPKGDARLLRCALCEEPHRNLRHNLCNACGKCEHGIWRDAKKHRCGGLANLQIGACTACGTRTLLGLLDQLGQCERCEDAARYDICACGSDKLKNKEVCDKCHRNAHYNQCACGSDKLKAQDVCHDCTQAALCDTCNCGTQKLKTQGLCIACYVTRSRYDKCNCGAEKASRQKRCEDCQWAMRFGKCAVCGIIKTSWLDCANCLLIARSSRSTSRVWEEQKVDPDVSKWCLGGIEYGWDASGRLWIKTNNSLITSMPYAIKRLPPYAKSHELVRDYLVPRAPVVTPEPVAPPPKPKNHKPDECEWVRTISAAGCEVWSREGISYSWKDGSLLWVKKDGAHCIGIPTIKKSSPDDAHDVIRDYLKTRFGFQEVN